MEMSRAVVLFRDTRADTPWSFANLRIHTIRLKSSPTNPEIAMSASEPPTSTTYAVKRRDVNRTRLEYIAFVVSPSAIAAMAGVIRAIRSAWAAAIQPIKEAAAE